MSDARGAIFFLPTATQGQLGPVAAWVSTAGWASAARRLLGDAWIVTPHGIVDPDEARRRASIPRLSTTAASSWHGRIPVVVKTAAKDVREWRRARVFRLPRQAPWHDHELAFVWQRHELFHTVGPDVAAALRLPSVLFVPAPLVWQSRQWGVPRPGWGSLVERFGERPALVRSDVVACGSDIVAEHVARLGVDDARIVVTPTGVDVDLFAAPTDPRALRRRLGIDGRFVVGWVGSFRRFHALELAVDAVAGIGEATLLLVGDGPERPRIERLARERGVAAVFTGTVPHDELAAHLAVMDVALVLAGRDHPFHYSPLKLAEYLAAGLPVIAPRTGDLTAQLTDGVDVAFVPPGDRAALAARVRDLRDDPDARARLGRAARAAARKNWSWDRAVGTILSAIESPHLAGRRVR